MKRELDLNSYGVLELNSDIARDIIGGGPFWEKVGKFFSDVWDGIKAGLGIKEKA